jgi:D-glycero-alpha-D-manno-heptose-7-phosphate kinase
MIYVIVSITPLRISLGGGGTDLPFYYSKNGGFVISAAIKKYVYVIVSDHFDDIIKLNYSKTELCSNFNKIQHPIFKHTLKFLKIPKHIEITSLADIPANSGLGSSGSFTVGLLNSLGTHIEKTFTKKLLAETAIDMEMKVAGEPVGKQDQYIASYGGFQCFSISKNGSVKVSPLKISSDSIRDLEHNLTFFYTGLTRKSSSVLNDQKASSEKKSYSFDYFDSIKKIGYQTKKYLENDNLDEFGLLLNEHWELKKNTSNKISNSLIDKYYNLAINNGASGGKLIGAGGGGFLMFYSKNSNNKKKLRKAFSNSGLQEIHMPFELSGSKIALNISGGYK